MSQEASSMGIQAGRWPMTIVYCAKTWCAISKKVDECENELLWVTYRSEDGQLLKVFND